MTDSDYAPILCKCGKVWTASERDAKEQCAFEDKLKNRETRWDKLKFYECDVEKGIWHWTRREWFDPEEFIKREKAKCKCVQRHNPKFASYDEAHAFGGGLSKVYGLKLRPYKCPKAKIYHLEYFLPEYSHSKCRTCNMIAYDPKKNDYRKVIEGLRGIGNRHVNTMVCKNKRFHVMHTIKKGK